MLKVGKGWRFPSGRLGRRVFRVWSLRDPRKSRQATLGGGLSSTASLKFTVLIERLLRAKAEVASLKSWARSAPNRAVTAIIGPGL